jgi:hemerythrin-like metal-binding protein
MTLMGWGPMLQIGYADIDAQHERLVGLVNQLDDAMRAGHGRDVVGQVLDDLIQYTVHHFAFEERLMDQYEISSSAAHKAEHKTLMADVTSFKATFDAGSAAVSTELMSFLRNWLSNHILKTDKALAKELLAKGAKSAA